MSDTCIENYQHLYTEDLLKGKVAFITGGGSGIGFTIAEMFMRHSTHIYETIREQGSLEITFEDWKKKGKLMICGNLEECSKHYTSPLVNKITCVPRHGCDTAIASRDVTKLQAAALKLSSATGRKCLAVQLDVRKVCKKARLSQKRCVIEDTLRKKNAELKASEVLAAVDKTLAEYGRIDIVVNNAAGNFLCSLAGMSFNAFKTVMEIDAHGTFNVSKAVYDKWFKNHGGVILNISATLHYVGLSLQAHAGAAKAAIDALTKHMAVEWGPDGVRVVGLAPGPIENTVGFNKLGGKVMGSFEMQSAIPVQRFGTRLDIAHSALFLVAETGSYVSGHTLVVDGGSWLTSNNGLTAIQQQALSKL